MGWKEQRMCPGSASWFPYITCRNICPSAWIPCWGRVLRRSRSSWSMTVRRTRRGPSAILMRSGIAGSGSSTNGMPGSAEPAMRVFGLRAAGIWVSWTATTGWIAIFAGHCTGGATDYGADISICSYYEVGEQGMRCGASGDGGDTVVYYRREALRLL